MHHITKKTAGDRHGTVEVAGRAVTETGKTRQAETLVGAIGACAEANNAALAISPDRAFPW
ncbi:hypothetical protein SAMN05216360_103366 [Methylobacterium phyllostachyos]|uniref:Uncharacterized protein n=1 Tax=Methylobacterium phyllostachyos TaxID=582672 RepID=A0A1G9W2R0_9HYPH|nr:hypothetical protein [Methylobacterium phyllostachyos]SDM78593.1 hypothetical protein SAMN05216360_103366 [Methylobacterium phyllostachyos]